MVIALAAVLFGLGLVAVNAVWPRAFVVTIASGGLLGAFMVLYEVRMTKRFAQAGFVRDLQTTFADNYAIQMIWSKLLLGEEICSTDRPAVSNYLTFFETLHLLVKDGTLDLAVADNLFRNRFFKAIGDKGILEIALAREKGTFANIHDFIAVWHDYLLARCLPIHAGYYSYVKGMLEARGYEVRRLADQDLPELVRLQDEVLQSLGSNNWMRANDGQMLNDCLTNPSHATIGVLKDGHLEAAAILFDGKDSNMNIRRHFTEDAKSVESAVNLKLVMVSQGSQRRAGLGRTAVELLEQIAVERGKSEILCTIHRENRPSQSLFKVLGYKQVGAVQTEYGKREVFARALPKATQKWAR